MFYEGGVSIMRNPDRIEPFLQKLGELWKHLPDYRFGQLICRLADEIGQDIFFPEEGMWLEKIDGLITKFEEREENNPEVEITISELYDLINEIVDDKNENQYRIKE